jgi:hypothetical protein
MSYVNVLLQLLLILALSSTANADPIDESESTKEEAQTLLDLSLLRDSPLEVHGFFSQGFLRSTQNNYLPNSKEGTTDFAEAGINFNKQLANNLRAGAQLFARDFGRIGNYNAKFDWFLLEYRWRNWLGFSAGRIKIPYGLYNETNDIDVARTPIFLPQSVYPANQRDYLLAQTGVEIFGYIDLSSLGAADWRIYRGTLQISPTSAADSPYQALTSDVPYVHGGRLIWNTPLEGLRLAGSYQDLLLNTDTYVVSSSSTIAASIKATLTVGSLEYITRDFQFTVEYSKWWLDLETTAPGTIPPTSIPSERYYGIVNFRVKEWLHPGVLHSVAFPNSNVRGDKKDFSKDTGIFCRLDLTPNWIFKAEWHFLDGTSGLSSQMNDGKTLNNLEQYWQMFMAKTTIYF